MLDGKKSISFKIFYRNADATEKDWRRWFRNRLEKGIANVTPQVEVKSRRVGGATFQIPQEIRIRESFQGNEVDDNVCSKEKRKIYGCRN